MRYLSLFSGIEAATQAWSMGANPRNKPFNDIELICRSGEKLEHFAENTVSQHATAEELNEPSCFDMKNDSLQAVTYE